MRITKLSYAIGLALGTLLSFSNVSAEVQDLTRKMEVHEHNFMREMFSNPKLQSREGILRFEDYIENLPTAVDECPYPLFHSFADGMYRREIHFNKGDLIVGAIHKNEYFVNVLKGRILVVSEFGSKEIVAPCSFTAKAGVKHIGYTFEDTVWVDTYKTDKTDVDEAEKELYIDSYEELDVYNNILSSNIRGESWQDL